MSDVETIVNRIIHHHDYANADESYLLAKEIQSLKEQLEKLEKENEALIDALKKANAELLDEKEKVSQFEKIREAAKKFGWPGAKESGPVWLELFEALNKLDKAGGDDE